MKVFHSGSPEEEHVATDFSEITVKANTTLPNLHLEVLKWLCLFLATTHGMTLSSHPLVLLICIYVTPCVGAS